MAGRSPNDAFENHIQPLRDALSYITRHRLTRQQREPFSVDVVYSLGLNDFRPVSLRGAYDLAIRVGQEFRIIGFEGAAAGSRYAVRFVSYSYQFAASNGSEILSFHWTPESPDPAAIRFPHAHIGPAITAGQTVLRPGNLHRAHIPTGPVSLSAIVRLAISEFGVYPLLDDWEARLNATEALLSVEGHG